MSRALRVPYTNPYGPPVAGPPGAPGAPGVVLAVHVAKLAADIGLPITGWTTLATMTVTTTGSRVNVRGNANFQQGAGANLAEVRITIDGTPVVGDYAQGADTTLGTSCESGPVALAPGAHTITYEAIPFTSPMGCQAVMGAPYARAVLVVEDLL